MAAHGHIRPRRRRPRIAALVLAILAATLIDSPAGADSNSGWSAAIHAISGSNDCYLDGRHYTGSFNGHNFATGETRTSIYVDYCWSTYSGILNTVSQASFNSTEGYDTSAVIDGVASNSYHKPCYGLFNCHAFYFTRH